MIIPFRHRKNLARKPAARSGRTAHESVRLVRLVRNRRWIDTRHLKLGMYVHELDRPWEETRFDFQGFRLDSPALIAEVQGASNMALVETQKLAASTGSVLLGPVMSDV